MGVTADVMGLKLAVDVLHAGEGGDVQCEWYGHGTTKGFRRLRISTCGSYSSRPETFVDIDASAFQRSGCRSGPGGLTP